MSLQRAVPAQLDRLLLGRQGGRRERRHEGQQAEGEHRGGAYSFPDHGDVHYHYNRHTGVFSLTDPFQADPRDRRVSRQARGLHHEGCGGPHHLRGQGEEPARADPLVLQRREGHQDPVSPREHGRHRGHHHRHRVRGADPREQPHQAEEAPLQHQPQGREDLPRHPHHRRGVPARVPHPADDLRRLGVLRPVPQAAGHRPVPAPDRAPLPPVQVPRLPEEARLPLPELPHGPLRRGLLRKDHPGGVPEDRRRGAQAPLGQERGAAAPTCGGRCGRPPTRWTSSGRRACATRSPPSRRSPSSSG